MQTFPFVAPATDGPTSYTVANEWSTQVVRAKNGREQRRQLYTVPIADFSMTWEDYENAATRVDTLEAFHTARQGATETFAFFDFDANRTWLTVKFGTGDGATTTFDLPCRNGSAFTIYDNASSVSGANYTITPVVGTNGRDRIVFTSARTSAHVLTATFTGQRWWPVRFSEDRLSYEVHENLLYAIGCTLVVDKASLP